MNIFLRFLPLLLSCCMAANFCPAQIVTVKDGKTKQTIPGVHLFNTDTSRTAVTNGQGEADIGNFGVRDSIIFRHSSYQSAIFTKSYILGRNNMVYLTEAVHVLDEFVFSATRSEEKKSDVPYHMALMKRKDIEWAAPQNSAELLEKTGQVFVQRSQMGGGSPSLRGFEANRILLVIDGVRMNNAIYRGGHLQNVITMDHASLDRVEVIFGPSSVIYGSDALGGVMHFYTRNPQLSTDSLPHTSSNYFIRYGTAAREKTVHADVNRGNARTGYLTSVTYSDFSDLRSGRKHHPDYPEFGKALYYADRLHGKDTVLLNPDPHVQRFTGYSQFDLLQKVLLQPNKHTAHLFNVQFSTSSDIPRYDRLQTYTDPATLKYADWHYGPQMRLLASYKVSLDGPRKYYDKAGLIVAYQNISENRIVRRFGQPDEEHQEETVQVASFNADFTKKIQEVQVNYGAEATYNNVHSFAYSNELVTGETYPIGTRYPDGGSMIAGAAAYLTGKWKPSEKWIASAGLRYSYIRLHAEFMDTTFFPFPFRTADQRPRAFNGNVGLVYMPGAGWRFNLLGSSGFKAPNVDDLGKVFDSQPGIVIVPNPELRPEFAYAGEIGISKDFFAKKLHIECLYFVTLLQRAIITASYELDSSATVMYQGTVSEVFANVNQGEAIIDGYFVTVHVNIGKAVTLTSTLTITDGLNVRENAPLDHIPPAYGKTSLTVRLKNFTGEFYTAYNGWKDIGDYSLTGEDNPGYATPDGTPSWYTLNLKASYRISKSLEVRAGVENLADLHYRVFASGISAPGRNFTFGIHAGFGQ